MRCERTLKRSLRGALAFGPLIGRSFIFIRASWTLSTPSPSLKLPLSCKHNSLAIVLLLLLLYTFDRHQVYRLPEIINRSCVVYTAALPRGFRHRYVVRTFRFIIYTASPTGRCKFNFIFITVILHFSFPFQLSAGYTSGEMTSRNLLSRYVRHFVCMTSHTVWSWSVKIYHVIQIKFN